MALYRFLIPVSWRKKGMFNSEIKQPQLREKKVTLPCHCSLLLPPQAPLTPLQTVLRWMLTLLWNSANYTSHLKYSLGLLYRDGYEWLASFEKEKKKIFSLILERWVPCFGKGKWIGEKEVWVFPIHPSNHGKVNFLWFWWLDLKIQSEQL